MQKFSNIIVYLAVTTSFIFLVGLSFQTTICYAQSSPVPAAGTGSAPSSSSSAAAPSAGTGSGSATTPTPTPASTSFGIGVEIPGEPNAGNSYKEYIESVYNFAIRLGGLLTTLMLIYAGYRYMTSQGNPTAINESKDILIGSLSGFALLLLVQLVKSLLGV